MDKDTFGVALNLTYVRPNGDVLWIKVLWVPDRNGVLRAIMFLSDGGSKPLWSVWLAGDRVDEGLLAYLFHDWLFTVQLILRGGVWVHVDEAYANDCLRELCLYVGMEPKKVEALYLGVEAGGWADWRKNPVDLNSVTPENLGQDFDLLDWTITRECVCSASQDFRSMPLLCGMKEGEL